MKEAGIVLTQLGKLLFTGTYPNTLQVGYVARHTMDQIVARHPFTRELADILAQASPPRLVGDEMAKTRSTEPRHRHLQNTLRACAVVFRNLPNVPVSNAQSLAAWPKLANIAGGRKPLVQRLSARLT